MTLYHPTRGGTRGGRDQFKWEDVKKDKDRECYLGHSLMAPVGKWQEGKDIMWYSSDKKTQEKIKNEEFHKAKEMEEEALMAALGYRVTKNKNPNDYASVERPVEIKKEKDSTHNEIIKNDLSSKKTRNFGINIVDTSSKKSIDKFLMNLLQKYDKKEIIEALGGSSSNSRKSSKKKKKSSKKKHRRASSNDDSSSSSENEEKSNKNEINKKRKSSSNKDSKSKKNKHSSSSSSSSTSNSDSDSSSD